MKKIDILKGKDVKKIIDLFKKPEFGTTKEVAESQYDVSKHKVFDTIYRPDKIINKDTGQKDSDGSPVTIKALVEVDRIGLPLQNQIVEQRIGFMLSSPVRYNLNGEADPLIKATETILKKNRMRFKDKEILRRQMSEMQCAELWYFVENEIGTKPKLSLKCKILSPSLGDELLPLYDEYGDMIAFGRKYKTRENDKNVDRIDIYTKDFDYKFVNRGNDWTFAKNLNSKGKVIPNPLPNPVGKIMVIYHSQYNTEWFNVQSMIERLEDSISNHGDMNDYFGSPILAVSGEVLGFVQKGEGGKILELSADARANYLTLNTPPESIKMEQENLRELTFSLTNTADISFDKVKGIGNLSAIALELLFISSSMAAKSKEETFSVGLQRRISLITTAIGKVIDSSLSNSIQKVSSDPEITPYMPIDIVAFIKMLGEAYEKGVMSIQAIVEANPLIVDKLKEQGYLIDIEKLKLTNKQTIV